MTDKNPNECAPGCGSREVTAFLGVYHEPLISEAHREIDEKTIGKVRTRKTIECRRGLLWMVCRVLTGGHDE